ncbi:uncharacterized protein LOC141639047 [Silene latifolia]|uniref:uncharacterized protein LOC141639047 n=1 Tax=Silene latifolia TaxID=37657 RepID=UPI003D7741A4
MYKVVHKLKGLKYDLKKLNKDQFWDIENLTHVAELSLRQFQNMLVQDPLNEDLCISEKECAKDIEELIKARDQFLRQKAKCEWMKHRDNNADFFHAKIKRRRAKNKVFQVKDMDNNLSSKPEDVKQAFEEYYKVLLGTSKKEIKDAMFAILGTKAPGPDGYDSQFFIDNWSIFGSDVIDAVKRVFQSEQLLK